MRVGVLGVGGGAVGTTTYQRTLLDGLRDMSDHEVSFVAPADDVTYTLPRSSPMRAFTNFVGRPDPRVRSAVRAAGVDIFIVNAAWPMPRDVRRWIAVVNEAVVDEIAPWGVNRSSHKRLAAKYLYRALDGASGVVAISAFTRDRLRDAFGINDAVVAPPALLGFDGDAPATAYPPHVTVVGWFHPRKDLPLALRAWRRAMEQGLDRDLVLVGNEGPDDRRHGSVRRRIVEIAGTELATRVHHTGPVPRPTLGEVLRTGDATIIASTYEGFGIPAIESFSFGRPVVAVDRGSLREVVAPHGTVVNPDADAIADALLNAVNDPPDAPPLIAYAKTFDVARQVRPVIGLLDAIRPSS